MLSNVVRGKISREKSMTKYENVRLAIQKQKSGSYDNLNIIGKDSVELVRKDSLDSKLAESCSNTDAGFHSDCSSHSFEHESLDNSLKEQNIKTLKTPISKTKNIKEGIGSKKKTKVVIHNKNNLSILNNSKSSQNINNLEKHVTGFSNEVYCTEEQLPSTIHVKPLCEEILDKSQVMLLNQSKNILVKNNETSLIQCNEQFSSETEEVNCNRIKDPARKTECNNENFNMKYNYDGKQVEKASENVKESAIDFENKIEKNNKKINLVGASSIFFTENPENIPQLNVSGAEKIESVDSSCMNPDEKTKRKQSITSLIRKLSLTQKARSVDDDTYSQLGASDKVWNNEIKDENDSELFSQSINRKLYLI